MYCIFERERDLIEERYVVFLCQGIPIILKSSKAGYRTTRFAQISIFYKEEKTFKRQDKT